MDESKNGQSLIELLIAIVVGVVFLAGVSAIIASSLLENGQAAKIQTSTLDGENLLNNVRVWSEGGWSNVLSLATGTNYQYYLITSSSPYTATSGIETLAYATTTYYRYFYLSDAYRTSSGAVTSTASGNTYDPSTKKVSVVYYWLNGASSTMSTYLTRNQEVTTDQTDWSGGTSPSGTTAMVTSQFASSSNINYTTLPGSIYVYVYLPYSTSTYSVGANPHDVTFDPHTDTVWFENQGSSTVTSINDTTFVTSTYQAGPDPHGLAFSSTTDSIWVADFGNTVTEINDTTFATTTYYMGPEPDCIAFDWNTNTIWVGNDSANTVTSMNLNTLATSTYAVGTNPYGIAFDSHTDTIWVSNASSSSVTVINDTTATSSTYTVGAGPHAITFDPNTNTVWVASWGSNTVATINDTTFVGYTYVVGLGNVYSMPFDPNTDDLWIPQAISNTVTSINDTTFATTTYGVGSSPQEAAFDSRNDSVWVADYDGSAITQLVPN